MHESGRSAGDHHQERALRQGNGAEACARHVDAQTASQDDRSLRLEAAAKRSLDAQMTELRQSLSQLQGRVTELEKDKAGLTNERDKLKEERDALKLANATLASQIIPLNDRATKAELRRTS